MARQRKNFHKHKRRPWKSPLPDHPILGMALVEAMKEYKRDLQKLNPSAQYDWIKILESGGRIEFDPDGKCRIYLPKPKKSPSNSRPKKGIWIGE